MKKWILSLVKNRRQHEKMQDKILKLENEISNLENKILLDGMERERGGWSVLNKIKKITQRPFLHGISFHLAEHCNLNCFSCDNFSQLA
ncbi:radical SAM protein, partial [Campylobacter jejuni]|nr:radical SAM protein [Campylobacter jejuni]